jgi:hypothetical protein
VFNTAYAGSGYPQSIIAAVTIDYSQTRRTLQAAGLPQSVDTLTADAYAFGHEGLGHGLGSQQLGPMVISSPLQTMSPIVIYGGDESEALSYERRYIVPALGLQSLPGR